MKRMYWILIVIGVVMAGTAVWWWRGKHAPMRLAELLVGSHAYTVEIADTIPLRTQGLSGREGLGEARGMLFIFSSVGTPPFWMKDMKFPLDFVWINGDKVIGTTERVFPGKGSLFSLPLYYPPEPADKVLEINAGEVEKWGIKVGDAAQLQSRE